MGIFESIKGAFGGKEYWEKKAVETEEKKPEAAKPAEAAREDKSQLSLEQLADRRLEAMGARFNGFKERVGGGFTRIAEKLVHGAKVGLFTDVDQLLARGAAAGAELGKKGATAGVGLGKEGAKVFGKVLYELGPRQAVDFGKDVGEIGSYVGSEIKTTAQSGLEKSRAALDWTLKTSGQIEGKARFAYNGAQQRVIDAKDFARKWVDDWKLTRAIRREEGARERMLGQRARAQQERAKFMERFDAFNQARVVRLELQNRFKAVKAAAA